MRSKRVLILAMIAMVGAACNGTGGDSPSTTVASEHAIDEPPADPAELAKVNLATAAFQDVRAAESAGYEAFLECFENSELGGMGQHYVNQALLDDAVDPAAPEAMVYEVTPEGLELAGVEYIVPGDLVDPEQPPQLFDRTFHLNEDLGVWVLHAWVWKDNPAGVFEDWNPKVRPCDTTVKAPDLPERLVEETATRTPV